MWRQFAISILVSSCLCGCVLAAEDLVSRCPKPSKVVPASCTEIAYKDLPPGARDLLLKMRCDVRSGGPYDYGSAVDLRGDGSLEYQFCCHEAAHGPCGSVLIGKIGNEWKDLTAKEGLLGFLGACNLFVVLESQQRGFHDVCLPVQCMPATKSGSAACVPTIWRYDGARYRATDATAAKLPGAR
jgi:hypothetical protein